MERQTKHRILGIFVVIALVIILLPFFQGSKELSKGTALVAAPPFPDQPVEIASIKEPAPTPAAYQVAETIQPVKSAEIRLHHDDIIPSKITMNEVKSPTEPVISVSKHQPSVKARTITAVKTSRQKSIKIPVKSSKNEGLLRLKGSVWVVQIGSFSNKTNALRIVNELRANGYRAFIQEITTAYENNTTRVYVGPLHKQTNARALADRLQSEMHLKGIVISYKPLSL